MWNKEECGNYKWEKNVFTPSAIKKAVGKMNEMFSGLSQNDSNEFIQFLLITIHEDLNRIKERPRIVMPSPEQLLKLTDQELQKLYTEAHLKQNQSIIQDIMFGQTMNVVRCHTCDCQSKNFEPFMTISVPLSKDVEPQPAATQTLTSTATAGPKFETSLID